MSIKLVVLDIDGTIAGASNQVNPGVVEAIGQIQAQGIPVALATGRMFCSALRFHRTVGSPLPVISYNGALTKNPASGEILRHRALPTDVALDILTYLEQPQLQPHLDVHCYHEDQLYVREITPETHVYMARSGAIAKAAGNLRPIVERSPTKMLAISRNAPLMANLIGDLAQRHRSADVHLTQSTEIYFEITHAQATKGLAVQHLAEELLGLAREEVLAIGDNFNDLEMLQYAGVGVAMGNAPQPVQAVADWVTGDVEADGVREALIKFCPN